MKNVSFDQHKSRLYSTKDGWAEYNISETNHLK